MSATPLAIILVMLSSIVGAVGGFAFKYASSRLRFNIRALLANYALVVGLFLFALAALLYLVALRHGDLNVLYPISALTYVWSLMIAKRFLHESINALKIIGILLILLGAAVIVS